VDGFAAVLETYNGNCWATFKKELARSKADVIVGQEIGVLADQIPRIQAWCASQGWHAIIEPSAQAGGGKLSAGVGVFARDYHGLRFPPGRKSGSVVPHRVVHAVVDMLGWPSLHVVGSYLHDGDGLSAANVAILAKIGEELDGVEFFAAGADWNLWPAQVEHSGLPKRLRASLRHPPKGVPTCETAKASSIIDFFMLSEPVARAIDADAVDTTCTTGPHKPYSLTFQKNVRQLEQLIFAVPPKLPVVEVYGPKRQEPDWTVARALAESAATAARTDAPRAAQRYLDTAWRWFANVAEDELIEKTGADICRGMRGRQAHPMWRKIIKVERSTTDEQQVAGGWAWLKTRLSTLRRLAGDMAGEWKPSTALNVHVDMMTTTDVEGTGLSIRLERYLAIAASLAKEVTLLGEETDSDCREEWANRLDSTMLEVDDEAKEADREHEKRSHDDWVEWQEQAFASGAGKMHAATKVRQQWTPTTCEDGLGGVTADPAATLEAEVEMLARYWQAQEWAPEAWMPQMRTAMPRATAQQIRAVAKTYPARTGQSIDGTHPRQISFLGDGALDTLAALYEAAELLGLWPRQLATILLQVIAKPKGGYREVVLFAGPVRVWERMRRAECMQWMRTWDRPYFAFTPGKGAELTVWRQTVRAEGATSRLSVVSAGALKDMRKFYESIIISRLAERWVRTGFPGPIARLCTNTWRGPRAVRFGNMLCKQRWHANCGLPAGTTFADMAVMAYTVLELDQLQSKWPLADLALYIDDSHVAATGTAEEVLDTVEGCSRDLAAVVQEKWGASFAEEKGATVATTQKLANSLSIRMGGQDGTASTTVENLGIDFQLGAGRAARGGGKVRRKRFAKLAAKRRNIMRLRNHLTKGKDRMGGIFKTGARPVAGYGATVGGLTDSELTRLRRDLLDGTAPRARGSATAKRVIHGDPAWREGLGPCIAWAEEVWRMQRGNPNALSAKELSLAWGSGVAEGRRTFAWSKGPGRRCILSLKRINWTMPSPFIFTDDFERTIDLRTTSPAQVKWLLREGNQRNDERLLGNKIGGRLDGKRAYVGAVRKITKPGSKRLDARGKVLAKALAADAVWTGERTKEAGYDVTGECPLCHAARDTVHHRLWWCTNADVVTARRRWAPDWLVAVARASDENDPLFNRGIDVHPAEDYPQPLMCEGCVAEDGDGNEIPIEDVKLSYFTFFDGSYQPHNVKELGRAAWALCSTSPSGRRLAALYGPVWWTLPQSPQSAEFVAAAAGANFFGPPIKLVGDCANVLRELRKTDDEQLDGRRMYAGVLLAAQEHDGWRLTKDAIWQKSHVDVEALEGTSRMLAEGNAWADELCKKAVLIHPQPSDEQEREAQRIANTAGLVLKLAGEVLRFFPHQLAERSPPRDVPPAAKWRKVGGHTWSQVAHDGAVRTGFLRCRRCARSVPSGLPAAERDVIPCSGLPPLAARVLRQPQGHLIVALTAAGTHDLATMVCLKCGAYGLRNRVGLGKQCPGEPSGWRGRRTLSRIHAGFHPHNESALDPIRHLQRYVEQQAMDDFVHPHAASWVPMRQRKRPTEAKRRPEQRGQCTEAVTPPPTLAVERAPLMAGGEWLGDADYDPWSDPQAVGEVRAPAAVSEEVEVKPDDDQVTPAAGGAGATAATLRTGRRRATLRGAVATRGREKVGAQGSCATRGARRNSASCSYLEGTVGWTAAEYHRRDAKAADVNGPDWRWARVVADGNCGLQPLSGECERDTRRRRPGRRRGAACAPSDAQAATDTAAGAVAASAGQCKRRARCSASDHAVRPPLRLWWLRRRRAPRGADRRAARGGEVNTTRTSADTSLPMPPLSIVPPPSTGGEVHHKEEVESSSVGRHPAAAATAPTSAAESRPELDEDQKARIAENRRRAQELRVRTAETAEQQAQPPSSGTQPTVAPARQPSSAQIRLEAMRARVRARIAGTEASADG